MKKNNLLSLLFILAVFLLSAGFSYIFFAKSSTTTQQSAVQLPKDKNGTVAFDNSLPKTEACPMNGALYSTQQRGWWESHRPLTIMIENHEEARPQSGISFADVTYEAVAEGAITRTLNIFYCQDGGQVGPVRSARTYFLDWASEYGDHPLYAHVGGANEDGPADALSQIDDYGWGNYNDMNQFSIGYPTFWRDYDRLGHETATEHTMYSTTSKLWDYAAKQRDLTTVDKDGTKWDKGFVPYTFKDDAAVSARPASHTVHVEFWEGFKAYVVDWAYDKVTNSYKRSNGNKPHLDRDTNKQLTAKNIIVMYQAETHANDGYEGNAHLLYKNKGTGKAVIFMDGKEIKGTWSKDDRTSRTVISDTSGTEIKFSRGKLWFEILPLDGILTVK